MMSTQMGSPNSSSASLIRSLLANNASTSALAGGHAGSPFQSRRDEHLVSSGVSRGPASLTTPGTGLLPTPSSSRPQRQAPQQDTDEILRAMLSLEESKNKEIAHLKHRVFELTSRCADLEASLAYAHRALEEEAGMNINLSKQSRRGALQSAFARWRTRFTDHRLNRMKRHLVQFASSVEESIALVPTVIGQTAPAVRKAMEDLSVQEKKIADAKVAFLQKSTALMFSQRSGDEGSPHGSALNVGGDELSTYLHFVKNFSDRYEELVASRLRLLLSSSQNTAEVERSLDGIRGALTTVHERHPELKTEGEQRRQQKPQEGDRTTEGVGRLSRLLYRTAEYDTVRDSGAVLTAVVLGLPIIGSLRRSFASCRDGDGARSTVAPLNYWFDAVEALLLQQPLTKQVESSLRTVLSNHFVIGEQPERRPFEGANEDVVLAKFCIEHPMRTAPQIGDESTLSNPHRYLSISNRDLLDDHGHSNVSKPLRWDLVHSILQTPTTSSTTPARRSHGHFDAAQGTSSSSSLPAAVRKEHDRRLQEQQHDSERLLSDGQVAGETRQRLSEVRRHLGRSLGTNDPLLVKMHRSQML